MHKYFLIIFLSFIFSRAAAQEKLSTIDSVYQENYEDDDYNDDDDNFGDLQGDTVLRAHDLFINADTLRAWKAQKNYNYQQSLDSLLKQWKLGETNKKVEIGKGLSFWSKLFSSDGFRIFLWIIALGFVGFVVAKLFLNKGLFAGRSKSISVSVLPTEDEIFLRQDFNALIHDAYKAGDLRVATRYLFLKLLHQLDSKGHITFAIDKTNSDYRKELAGQYNDDFLTVSGLYEQVWYGYKPTSADSFSRMEESVNKLIKLSA